MRFFLPIGLLVLVLCGISAADNWPQFRGPAGNGVSTARDVPTTWSETENVRWKTAIHDRGWSSPVIWGNQIWLTTAREDGKEFFAVCVDRASGKIVHDLKMFTEEKPAFCHPFNSYASPTPVLEEGRVYVHFGVHGTACLDSSSGKIIWQRRDLPCNHWRGPGSSPVVFGKLLILTFDGHDLNYLIALDKETGNTVWRKDRNIKYSTDDGDYHKAYSTPSLVEVGGKTQLVSPSAEATIAYDPATGEELWRVIHGGMNAASRPVFFDDLVFLTSGHSKNLLALRMGGSGNVTKDVAWKTANRGVPTRSSMLVVDDLLYSVTDQGVASCFEAKTGKRLWEERLGGEATASPVFADGHIYFADQDGKTFVIEKGRSFKSVAVNKLASGCMASLAVTDGTLFIRTKTHLYRVGSK